MLKRTNSSTFRAGLLACAFAVCGFAATAEAAKFTFANDGDVNSMDPYARQETFLLSFDNNIYGTLLTRDRELKLEPDLATSWEQTSSTSWKFNLRTGVTFADGTPFTADDVVFSYERVKMPGSNLSSVVSSVKAVNKVDDHTVEFVTSVPDPILPDEITEWMIMSKAWCEKNNAVKPADVTKGEESFASRNANGTGPFMIKERQPDVKTVLVPNPKWWRAAQKTHNLDEVTLQIIKEPLTRVSALLSGEIDMIYNTPIETIDRIKADTKLKVLQTPEIRTVFLGLDQSRDELLESNIKGKNPFRDKRVRQAFFQAIDENAIAAKVMRGFAAPTALMVGKGINGFDPSLNTRVPYDVAAAKKLLTEAGYPNGFEVGLDCPNDRYVNDEQICQAVVAMLARVGVKVNLLAQTRLKFFSKVQEPGYNTSFYMLGWSPNTYDAHNVLLNLLSTRDRAHGVGTNNDGGYSNPDLDKLTAQIGVETDKTKRDMLIHQALALVKDDYASLPLHQQVVVWATKQNVDIVQTGDNYLQLRFIKVN